MTKTLLTVALLCTAVFHWAAPPLAANKLKEREDNDRLQQSPYLPMAKGNKWTYRKTVHKGTKVFCWEAWEFKGKLKYVHLPLDKLKPGVTMEEYKVTDEQEEDGKKRWTIDVGDAEQARDGRYGGIIRTPEKIMWGRFVSSEHLIEFGEILVAENVFEGTLRQERTLLLQPLLPNLEAHSHLLTPVVYKCSAKRKTVTVPAGEFSGCLEVTMIVSGKGGNEWSTISYYAPSVGLVKEYQRDPDDKTTYTMELTDYELQKTR
jgi:hypothetical protein